MESEAIEFMVEQLPEGSYIARCLGACIMTEADTLEELQQQIKEAICCYFDDGCSPRSVRLRYMTMIREEVVTL